MVRQLHHRVCATAEALKFRPVFCALGFVGFGVLIVALLFTPAVSGVVVSLCSVAFGFFGTLLFTACPQRKAVVGAAVDGYWRNFLYPVLKTTPYARFVIVRPDHHVIGIDPNQVLDDAVWRRRLTHDGFVLDTESLTTDQSIRTVHTLAHADYPGVVVAIDFARNLNGFREIAFQETASAYDRICSVEHKFHILSTRYFDELRTRIGAARDVPDDHVIVLDGTDHDRLCTELHAVLSAHVVTDRQPGRGAV